jgi:hypothetical protein
VRAFAAKGADLNHGGGSGTPPRPSPPTTPPSSCVSVVGSRASSLPGALEGPLWARSPRRGRGRSPARDTTVRCVRVPRPSLPRVRGVPETSTLRGGDRGNCALRRAAPAPTLTGERVVRPPSLARGASAAVRTAGFGAPGGRQSVKVTGPARRSVRPSGLFSGPAVRTPQRRCAATHAATARLPGQRDVRACRRQNLRRFA